MIHKLHHDPRQCFLGRRAVKKDPRTFRLAKYISPTVLPRAPLACDWAKGVGDFGGVMLNDREGCCTASGAGHAEMILNAQAGHPVTIPDQAVQGMYVAVTGQEGSAFDPKTGDNDNGCNELDVLKYWRNTGIGGHQIDAFASVEPAAHDLLQAGLWLFGGLYVGVALPISAQNQDVWHTTGSLTGPNRPGSWGGHCVWLTADDADGFTCITWGQEKRLTWQWWDAYGEEAYVVLSRDWLTAQNVAPSSFNFDQLQTDLSAL